MKDVTEQIMEEATKVANEMKAKGRARMKEKT